MKSSISYAKSRIPHSLTSNTFPPLASKIALISATTALYPSSVNFPGALMWSEAFKICYSHCKRLWKLTSLSHCSKCIEILLGVIDYSYKEGYTPQGFMPIFKAGSYWHCEVSFSFNHIFLSLHLNKHSPRKTSRILILNERSQKIHTYIHRMCSVG